VAEQTTTIDVRIEPAPPGAEPFIPGKKEEVVEFQLEPVISASKQYSRLWPPVAAYAPVPFTGPTMRSLIVNIETTGFNPWDSRLTMIAFKDPALPDEPVKLIYGEDEEAMLREFVNMYVENGYDEFVGYNVVFDFRFLFAKCMRYRISAPSLFRSEVYDVLQVMAQVNRKFMPGKQKGGKLDTWGMFLFDEQPYSSEEEMLRQYALGNIKFVAEFDFARTRLTWKLWALIQYVKGQPLPQRLEEIHELPETAPFEEGRTEPDVEKGEIVTGSPVSVPGWQRVVSKITSAEQWVQPGTREYRDFLTGKRETVEV